MGIGDELMAAGRARAEFGGRKTHILDRRGRPRWHDAWSRCDWIARPDEPAVHELMDAPGVRPYIRAKAATRWTWADYRPQPCPLRLTDDEMAWAEQVRGAIVLAPELKAHASPNKAWPGAHWSRLANMLHARFSGVPLVHLQPPGSRSPALPHARLLHSSTIFEAAAAVRVCAVLVCHEGALHHLSAGMGGRAVVLMGGFIGPQHTGYRDCATHTYLVSGGTPCGMRVRCEHCVAAMLAIEPGVVVREAGSLYEAACFGV